MIVALLCYTRPLGKWPGATDIARARPTRSYLMDGNNISEMRSCSRCGVARPLDHCNFAYSSRGTFRMNCRSCIGQRKGDHRPCSRCGGAGPFAMRTNYGRSMRNSWCTACISSSRNGRRPPRRKTIARECRLCGREFGAPLFSVKKGLGIYCSRACSSRSVKRLAPTERFWKYVEKTESCWLWTGWKNNKGYGVFGGSGDTGRSYAHRFSFEVAHGALPPDAWVLHRCDTPACVNPAHLFLGDCRANVDDCVAKRRHAFGEAQGTAKLTEADVLEIRATWPTVGVARLAEKYRISQRHLRAIVSRRFWKHI